MSPRRTLPSLAAALLLLAAGRPAVGQTLPPGPQVLTYFSDVDDSDQPYALYLPRNFKADTKYPLVVSLHGAGSNHRLNLRRVFGKSNKPGETDVEATRYFPEWRGVDYIVACPLARGTMGYQGIAEKDVYDVLADVKKRFAIDEDRVYLTGLSMGGGGTLWLGLTRPDLWAAIAPVCPAPPRGTEELAGNALNVPVHVFEGGADPAVKPDGVREFVKRLEGGGVKVEYTEYPGVGHNSWENAYKDGAIFDWFARFRRNRHPDRVSFATSAYKYPGAYWVHIDELTPGTLAKVDARFTGPNRLEITTANLRAFTLHLAGHPKFSADRPVELTVDGKALSAKAADSLTLVKAAGRWTPMKYEAPAHAKGSGAEGPIAEGVAGRHVYVYGTADNPSQEEVRKRRVQAARAAEWSMRPDSNSPLAAFLLQVRPPAVFFRVLADRDVRPSDLETSNLVLFGTKETNSLIAKLADRLPVQLHADAGGYGLLFVYPAGDHYVLVSSGLPWWTGDDRPPAPAPAGEPGRRPRFRFFGWPAGTLSDFKDYLLFKDTPDNVVAEGHFDGRWRIPEADAQKMKATGAVTVNGAAQAGARAPDAGTKAPEPTFNRREDVIYGRKYGTALTMDVFTPKEGANGAGVIWAVSGGWYSDHSSIRVPLIAEFLRRGYTVFAVVHGSQPRFTIPEVLDDMHRAVRYIRAHAKDYAIDPNRLGIAGASAGGHLSLMQATAGRDGDSWADDPVERFSSRVQAAACFAPPTDFLNYGEKGKVALGRNTLEAFKAPFDFQEFDRITRSFNLVLDETRRREVGRQVSPLYHASRTSAPCLIIHGDADKLVPIQQAEVMVAKLKEVGVPAELVVKKGAGHGWPYLEKDVAILADWFDRHLLHKTTASAAPAPAGSDRREGK
jgi:acetyl esterase/lipase